MVLRRVNNIFEKIRDREINAEIIVAFIFMIISGTYLFYRYGTEKLLETIFFWMFPASIMIFLTLLLVKIIEKLSRRDFQESKYLDLRSTS